MSITPESFSTNSPAELALPLAEKLVMQGYYDGFVSADTDEQAEVVALEAMADLAGMLGQQYLVSSGRSVAIPVSFEAGQPVRTFDFNEGLDFSGTLVTYGSVRIGRNLGGNAIRALCLTFDNVTLLPYFNKLQEDRLLYTPAFAVRSIDILKAS